MVRPKRSVRMAADYSDRMSCVFCNNVHDAGTLLSEDDHTWVVREGESTLRFDVDEHGVPGDLPGLFRRA